MDKPLEGQTIAILATDGVERIELEEPRGALLGAGARTEVLSIHDGEIQARQMDIESAGTIPVDRLVSDASIDDYDALLLPGGTVNPDKLRTDAAAVQFVRAFAMSGKPVAAICHGPWTLRTDLRNAGADVVDEELVVDEQFTTSRSPHDLPAFCAGIVEQFARRHAAVG